MAPPHCFSKCTHMSTMGKNGLSRQKESGIVKWCNDLAKCGFPLKTDDLLNTVQNIMIDEQRVNPFTNNRPGKKWLQCFFKRNPILSIRTPEKISKGRAVITEESIRKWFNNLKEYLISIEAVDILNYPERILNGDETSFIICPKTGKVIAPRGYKNVYQISKGNEKEAITVLAFFSANGDILLPCVVFPCIRTPKDVINSMPDDWFLGKSDTGWMKAEIFFDYISKGLNKWLEDRNISKPVLVFVDGHKSHLTMTLSQYCFNNDIILYALPPNTTHLMQPADVSVFRPLKSEWKTTIHDWASKPENVNTILTKVTFCPLLNKVLSKETLKDIIKNGFPKCGLYPFDPNAVDYTKCIQNNLERLKNNMSNIESLNKSPTDLEFDTASMIIKHLNKDLMECGVNVEVVLDVIRKVKDKQNLNNTAQTEITQNFVMLDNYIEDSSANTTTDDIVQAELIVSEESNDKSLLSLNNNAFVNNVSDNEIHTGIFQLNDKSILIPLDDEVLNPVNIAIQEKENYCSKHKASSDVLIRSQEVSPVLRQHLRIPSPIQKSSTSRNINRIGAISSAEWRTFETIKQEEKEKKKVEIQERKLQRQKAKQEKQEEIQKRKQKRLFNKNLKKRKLEDPKKVITEELTKTKKKIPTAKKNKQNKIKIVSIETVDYNISKEINKNVLELTKKSNNRI